jgi:hypothetical protein
MASPESTPSPERRRRGAWATFRRKILRANAREDGPRVDLDIMIATLFSMLMLLGGLAGLTLYQQGRISSQQHDLTDAQQNIGRAQERLDRQQRSLAYLERRDRIGAYQTAFRFCTRIDVDRAAVHDLWAYELPRLSKAKIQPRVRRFLRGYTQRLEDCRSSIASRTCAAGRRSTSPRASSASSSGAGGVTASTRPSSGSARSGSPQAIIRACA